MILNWDMENTLYVPVFSVDRDQDQSRHVINKQAFYDFYD